MRRSEARAVLEAARGWNRRGMFKPGAFDQVEKELSGAAAEDQPGLAMQAFYSVGGLMLGAASAALYALLQLNDLFSDEQGAAWAFFLASAVVLVAVGAALHASRQRDLGDALLLAGLVPTAILIGPRPPGTDALWLVPAVVALALLAWRRARVVVPLAALAVALVALPVALVRMMQEDAGSLWWVLTSAAALAGLVVWDRTENPRWGEAGTFGATVSLGLGWLMLVSEVIEPSFETGIEVLLGAGLLLLVGLGVLVKEPPIVWAAGGGLTIDAIVFAFDIGGPTLGLVVLLGLSAGLITLGAMFRRRSRPKPGSTPP